MQTEWKPERKKKRKKDKSCFGHSPLQKVRTKATDFSQIILESIRQREREREGQALANMDEFEFQRVLNLFPIVRPRDYHVNLSTFHNVFVSTFKHDFLFDTAIGSCVVIFGLCVCSLLKKKKNLITDSIGMLSSCLKHSILGIFMVKSTCQIFCSCFIFFFFFVGVFLTV